MKTKGKLEKSQFMDAKPNEPREIIAKDDGIAVHTDIGIVWLRPHHVARVVEMASDWWTSHWSALYDENDD